MKGTLTAALVVLVGVTGTIGMVGKVRTGLVGYRSGLLSGRSKKGVGCWGSKDGAGGGLQGGARWTVCDLLRLQEP